MRKRWLLALALIAMVTPLAIGIAEATESCGTCKLNNCNSECGAGNGFCGSVTLQCGTAAGNSTFCIYECGNGSVVYFICIPSGSQCGGGSPIFAKHPTNP